MGQPWQTKIPNNGDERTALNRQQHHKHNKHHVPGGKGRHDGGGGGGKQQQKRQQKQQQLVVSAAVTTTPTTKTTTTRTRKRRRRFFDNKPLCMTIALLVLTVGIFLNAMPNGSNSVVVHHNNHTISSYSDDDDDNNDTNSTPPDDDDDDATDDNVVDDKTTANNINNNNKNNINKLTALSLASFNRSIPPGCESTVMIIRQCEKDKFSEKSLISNVPDNNDDDNNNNKDQHCSYVGYQRAHYLPTLFGGNNNKWPIPTVLYALTEERKNHDYNYRAVETLEPLAKTFHLPILRFATNPDVAKDFLTKLANGEMCNQVALISWNHSWMADLAIRELGCRDCPNAYPRHTHDEVWLIRYVYDVLQRSSTSTPPMLRLQQRHEYRNHVMAPSLSSSQKQQQEQQEQQVEKQQEEEEERQEPSLEFVDRVKEDDQSDNQQQPQRLRGLRRRKEHYYSTAIDDDDDDDVSPPASFTTTALLSQQPPQHTINTTTTTTTSAKVPRWSVYSIITAQHFDPLRFSHTMGDYVDRGAPGGKWWSSSASLSSSPSTPSSKEEEEVVKEGEF